MKAKDIRIVHRGSYLCMYEIDYITESGRKKTYEMVSRQGCTALGLPDLTLATIGKKLTGVVLCVFNETEDKILLTNEFRLGVNRNVVGNVAGLVDKGESIKEACRRELKEETNLDISSWLNVFDPTFTSAPITDDITQLVVCKATGELGESDSDLEEVNADWYTKDEVRAMLKSTEYIFSSRTQIICQAWVQGVSNSCKLSSQV